MGLLRETRCVGLIKRRLNRRLAIAAAAMVVSGAVAATIVTVEGASTQGAAQAQLTAQAVQHAAQGAARHRGFRLPLLRALVAATAKETGIPVATIRQDLRAGETLNQIAGAKAGAVINDVLARVKVRLDKARDAGKITQAQETRLLARATARIDHLMSAHLTKAAPSPHASASAGAATTT